MAWQKGFQFEPTAQQAETAAAVKPRARARRTDPETSHLAAQSVRDVRASQQQVMALFEQFGAMHDELLIVRAIAVRTWQSESGLRTRRNELVKMGRLRDSGQKVKTKGGRNSVVWEVAR